MNPAAWDSGLPDRAESHCVQCAIRLVCAMQDKEGTGPIVDSKASWEDKGGGLLVPHLMWQLDSSKQTFKFD